MKAAVVEKFGKPLKIKQVPVPTVKPGTILVKVAALWCLSHRFTRCKW